MEKMYVLIKFKNKRNKNKKIAAVPIIWIIVGEQGIKCWWPKYGLPFKLKNIVPPPLLIDIDEVKKMESTRMRIRC